MVIVGSAGGGILGIRTGSEVYICAECGAGVGFLQLGVVPSYIEVFGRSVLVCALHAVFGVGIAEVKATVEFVIDPVLGANRRFPRAFGIQRTPYFADRKSTRLNSSH